jgi:FAD synthase
LHGSARYIGARNAVHPGHTALIAGDLGNGHKTKARAAIVGGEPKPTNIPEPDEAPAAEWLKMWQF